MALFAAEMVKEAWIGFAIGGKYPLKGEIGEVAVIPDIFHVFVAEGIKLMEDGVIGAVEFQGQDVEAAAQRQVEGRGGLQPFVIQVELGVAVVSNVRLANCSKKKMKIF